MIQPVGRRPGFRHTSLSRRSPASGLTAESKLALTARRSSGAAQSKPRKQSLELPAAQLAVSEDLREQTGTDGFARMNRDHRCPTIRIAKEM